MRQLTYSDPQYWETALYKILYLQPGAWETSYNVYVEFVKTLSQNWTKSMPELLQELDEVGVGLDSFFKLERNVTFKLASLIADINVLQKSILNSGIDLSPFVSKLSSAFLPTVVYQLEEYGLPRMITKKIHKAGLINFEDPDLTLNNAILKFQEINYEDVVHRAELDPFDVYIYNYFLDGIAQSV